MCALQPLRPEVLVVAVAQNPDDEQLRHPERNLDIHFILDACCNLLVVDAKEGVCRLSHLSL